MSKKKSEEISDIEECKDKIQKLLREYNCALVDQDEGSWVLLWDMDTDETINVDL